MGPVAGTVRWIIDDLLMTRQSWSAFMIPAPLLFSGGLVFFVRTRSDDISSIFNVGPCQSHH
jgi:hypothetical protein